MVTMATVFPFRIQPLNNIQPFTYRDTMSHMQLLEHLRCYVEGLGPDLIAAVNEMGVGFNTAMDIQDAEFTTRFAAHVTAINALVATINNRTGPQNMQRIVLTADTVLNIDPTWPTAHWINVQVRQDATGGHNLALGTGIAGQIDLYTLPNSLTEFALVPNGDSTWHIHQPDSSLPGDFPDATNADLITDTTTLTSVALHALIDPKLDSTQGGILYQPKATFAADVASLSAVSAHHARHEWGGADALTPDIRQLVSPVRDFVRSALQGTRVAPFRYVMMGDSQTNDGSLVHTDDNVDVWGGGKGYSYRFAALLTKEVPARCEQGTTGVTGNTQPGTHVWTSAVAGRRSDNYAEAGTIANIGTISPHLVTHMIGTNDFTLQFSPDSYYTNVLAAINNVWSVAPNARQLFIMPWPAKDPAGIAHAWTEYRDKIYAIRDLLKGDNRFELLDFGSQFERSGGQLVAGGGLNPWWSLSADGIHGDPRMHRALVEQLALWAGLPSPSAAFGGGIIINGSKVKAGVMDNANPSSNLTVYAAPVPRTIVLHIELLCTTSAEGDINIQAVDDYLNKVTYPRHVQAHPLQSKSFTLEVEQPANKNMYYYLSGTSQVTVQAGVGYDQYNQFYAETKYA